MQQHGQQVLQQQRSSLLPCLVQPKLRPSIALSLNDLVWWKNHTRGCWSRLLVTLLLAAKAKKRGRGRRLAAPAGPAGLPAHSAIPSLRIPTS